MSKKYQILIHFTNGDDLHSDPHDFDDVELAKLTKAICEIGAQETFYVTKGGTVFGVNVRHVQYATVYEV